MRCTTRAEHGKAGVLSTALFLCLGLATAPATAAQKTEEQVAMPHAPPVVETLSAKQQAIPLIAASMATSDMPKLSIALNQGLDAGLTISESKEILVQLYAYVGFPKSLNALGELLKIVDARKRRGIQDAPGREPKRPIPT